jgi:hypothetical protein
MQAVKGLSMEKGLCWAALVVAGLMLLLFVLDLTIGVFSSASLSATVDICGILAAGVLGYLAWDALRSLR